MNGVLNTAEIQFPTSLLPSSAPICGSTTQWIGGVAGGTPALDFCDNGTSGSLKFLAAHNTITGTATTPSSGTGANGDYYVVSTTGCEWGPKASGSWPGSAAFCPGTGSGSGPTLETAGTNNASQTALNFIPSSADAMGLHITPSNPATSSEKFEVTVGNGPVALGALGAASAPTNAATVQTASFTPSCGTIINPVKFASAGTITLPSPSVGCALTFDIQPASAALTVATTGGTALYVDSAPTTNQAGTFSIATPPCSTHFRVQFDGTEWTAAAPTLYGSGATCTPSAAGNTLTASGGATVTHSITIPIMGSPIVTGTSNVGTPTPPVQFSCTIGAGSTKVSILSPVADSMTVAIWKANLAIPTSAGLISASAPVSLSSATINSTASLTGWTTSVSVGDVFWASVTTAPSTTTTATIQIGCQ
jgi:hypothetical protein